MSELNIQLEEQLTKINNIIQEAYHSYLDAKIQGNKRLLKGTLLLAAITLPVMIAFFIIVQKSLGKQTQSGIVIACIVWFTFIWFDELTSRRMEKINEAYEKRYEYSRTIIAENKILLSILPVRFLVPKCIKYIAALMKTCKAESLEQALVLADNFFYKEKADTALSDTDKEFIEFCNSIYENHSPDDHAEEKAKGKTIISKIEENTFKNKKWYVRAISKSVVLFLFLTFLLGISYL